MDCCRECGCPVSLDETAITKKLINRGLTYSLCIRCLAEHFEVTQDAVRERIEYYKSMGCTLFAEKK